MEYFNIEILPIYFLAAFSLLSLLQRGLMQIKSWQRKAVVAKPAFQPRKDYPALRG